MYKKTEKRNCYLLETHQKYFDLGWLFVKMCIRNCRTEHVSHNQQYLRQGLFSPLQMQQTRNLWMPFDCCLQCIKTHVTAVADIVNTCTYSHFVYCTIFIFIQLIAITL